MTWLAEMQRIFLKENVKLTDILYAMREIIALTSQHKGY